MKTIIYIITLIIALPTLYSCSADSDLETPVDPDGLVQIRPNTNIPTHDKQATRAGGVIEPGAAITASFFRIDETFPANWSSVTAAISGSIAATTGTVTFSPLQYYAGNKNTKLVGVYPAVGSGTTWAQATGTGTATCIIDGFTDIMVTPIVQCNRLAQPSMTFNHLLTQVKFTVIAADATAIAQWGTVNSVTVTGRANSCAIVLPVPTVATGTTVATPTFSGSTSFAARTKAGGAVSPVTVTTTDKEFGYCMFAPVPTAAALPLTVVTSNGGTVNINVPAQVYAVSNAYTIQLRLTTTGITATASIAAWTPVTPQTTVTL